MPISYTIGGETYTVNDTEKHAKNSSFSIGLGIGDNLEFMYNMYWNDNGYNFREEGWKVGVNWLFFGPRL